MKDDKITTVGEWSFYTFSLLLFILEIVAMDGQLL